MTNSYQPEDTKRYRTAKFLERMTDKYNDLTLDSLKTAFAEDAIDPKYSMCGFSFLKELICRGDTEVT